jgi:hypothetical protein
MAKNPVFEETYQNYLAEINRIDFLSRAELLGVKREGEQLIVPLYDKTYNVSAAGIVAENGETANPAVRVILSKYILSCREYDRSQPDPLMTYRDFRGASPLVSYFTTNTNKTLVDSFSGKIDELKMKCLAIGGVERSDRSYDCSFLFYALPRIPVIVNFNDKDDLFDPSCSVLYRASAANFLDMECLAMTGTLLSGKLIR